VSRGFIEGRNVTSLGGRPPYELLQKLIQGLDALQHAHARGIAHGDLTETKILIDRAGNVQIADFLVGGALRETLHPIGAHVHGGEEPETEDLTALGTLWLRLMTGATVPATSPGEASARLTSAGLGVEAADALARLAAPPQAGHLRDLEGIREALAGSIAAESATSSASAVEPDTRPAEEKLVVPVRPWERAGQIDGPDSERSRRRSLGIAFALLLGVAFLVFFWLPSFVSESDPPRGTQSDPATAAPSVSERAGTEIAAAVDGADPEIARKLLGDALNRMDDLRVRGAEEWANTPFAEAEDRIASGVRAEEESDFGRATAQYRRALEQLDRVEARSVEVLEEALETAAALAPSDPAAALEHYALALRIDPDNETAASGTRDIQAAQQFLSSMREGEQRESDGRLTAARDAYARATAADPQSAEARTALERVEASLSASAYKGHMARAMTSLARDDPGTAETQVERALAARPTSSDALDLQWRIRQRKLAISIAEGRIRVVGFEREEKWDEAVVEFRRILALDGTLAFATEGLARAERLAAASRRFDAWIAQPSLLFDDRTREEARQDLEFTRQLPHPGPRLRKQIRRVSVIEKAASTPVSVVFESDGATEVKILRHGTLGAFTRREIPLKPGTYAVLGIRRGFRDVRQTVTVIPGKRVPSVVVSCTEAI
jgi:tetratricopeptide (TPR) repeat protein